MQVWRSLTIGKRSISCISFLLIFWLLLPAITKAQVVMISYPPGEFQISLNDLWHMDIFIPSSSTFGKYFLEMHLSKEGMGLILQGQSEGFRPDNPRISINKYNQIHSIGKIQYQYMHPHFYDHSGLGASYLTDGQYNIVFYLYGLSVDPLTGKTLEKIEQNAYSFRIKGMNPPELLSVYRGDSIDKPNPVFTWLSPLPLYGEEDISYYFRLVRVYENQDIYEAFHLNPPWAESRHITQTLMLYPFTARSLSEGLYAWQISAEINGNTELKSEIWHFYFRGKTSEQKKENETEDFHCYLKLDDMNPDVYAELKGVLKFAFLHTGEGGPLQYKIYDNAHRDISPPLTLEMNHGMNYFSIDLQNYRQFKNNQYYTLKIENSNSSYLLRFFYKKDQ
jgi:hypothetical protein